MKAALYDGDTPKSWHKPLSATKKKRVDETYEKWLQLKKKKK
jgi:hypothetical protein